MPGSSLTVRLVDQATSYAVPQSRIPAHLAEPRPQLRPLLPAGIHYQLLHPRPPGEQWTVSRHARHQLDETTKRGRRGDLAANTSR